ncbi:CDP-alcohol phosphatidyltransferase family protein [Akkermansia muciniphila]|nr:CDP-alcohol phosphatidyltransferase family protein [Akkermansia muciniphila]
MLNLPNAITLTRIALVVVFTAAVSVADQYSWGYLAALVTFILAACTDWLDGYLARRLNQVTTFGKLIDPLADKIAVSAAFIYLTGKGSAPPGLPFSSSAGNSWSPDCARLRRIMASSSLRERPANGKPHSSWPSASPACWP